MKKDGMIVLKLRAKRGKINSFIPAFLCIFFFLSFLPYISARVDFLNAFFTGPITKVIYRGGVMVLLCLFSVILWIVNELKINRVSVIVASALLIGYAASMLSSPAAYSYSVFQKAMRWDIHYTSISWNSHVSYFLSFFSDCVFFISMISFIAPSIKTKRAFSPVLVLSVLIATVSVVYAIVFEKDKIQALLNGASGYSFDVMSLFHSKNSFGISLFMACLSIFGILFAGKLKVRFLLLPLSLVFFGFAFVIQCKSSFVCGGVVFLFSVVYSIWRMFKANFKISIAVVSSIVFLLIVAFTFLFVDKFASLVPGLISFRTKLINALSNININAIFSRTSEWNLANNAVYGRFSFFGINDANNDIQMHAISVIEGNESVSDYHSGYVTWYAVHGIFGSVVYLGIIGKFFVDIFKIRKIKKDSFLFLLFLMISSMVFMIPESFTIVISCSGATFVLNALIIGLISLETRKGQICEK